MKGSICLSPCTCVEIKERRNNIGTEEEYINPLFSSRRLCLYCGTPKTLVYEINEKLMIRDGLIYPLFGYYLNFLVFTFC
jgi:hypothetical protein